VCVALCGGHDSRRVSDYFNSLYSDIYKHTTSDRHRQRDRQTETCLAATGMTECSMLGVTDRVTDGQTDKDLPSCEEHD